MTRELYSKRLFHVIKDFKDQPTGRYNVFVHDVFGDKVVITCDMVDVTPVAVVCKRESDKLNEKGGVMVAVIPARDVGWGIIENDRVIHMTGAEWEEYKAAEAKDQLDLYTKVNGNDKITKVMVLPDGRQIKLPVTVEDMAAMEEAKKVEEKPAQPDQTYGVSRTHI